MESEGNLQERSIQHFAETETSKIAEMAGKEYEHLQTADEISEYVEDVERSKEADIPVLRTLHRRLRMKYRWYYRWHLDRRANGIHFVALAVFLLAVIIEFILL